MQRRLGVVERFLEVRNEPVQVDVRVNLPVEFDASARAKRLLVDHGIVPDGDMIYVNRVLNAAAWTYVAATLQAVMTLLYYLSVFGGGND